MGEKGALVRNLGECLSSGEGEKTQAQSQGRMGTFEKHPRPCPNVAAEYNDEKPLAE